MVPKTDEFVSLARHPRPMQERDVGVFGRSGPLTFWLLFPGGLALPNHAHGHCNTGGYFQGDPERLLCQIVQAGGQHEWGGLDGLPAWQKPQGRWASPRVGLQGVSG